MSTSHYSKTSKSNRIGMKMNFDMVEQAYIELLEVEPYQRILVKEIVHKARVPRSSFYRQYGGSLEVLERIEQNLLEALQLYPNLQKSMDKPFDCFRAWFESCEECYRAINAVAGDNGDPYFARRLKERLVQQITQMMVDDRLVPEQMFYYVSEALASMCVGLMMRFAKDCADDCAPDPSNLATMVNLLRIAYHNDIAGTPDISAERLYGESVNAPIWNLD